VHGVPTTIIVHTNVDAFNKGTLFQICFGCSLVDGRRGFLVNAMTVVATTSGIDGSHFLWSQCSSKAKIPTLHC